MTRNTSPSQETHNRFSLRTKIAASILGGIASVNSLMSPSIAASSPNASKTSKTAIKTSANQNAAKWLPFDMNKSSALDVMAKSQKIKIDVGGGKKYERIYRKISAQELKTITDIERKAVDIAHEAELANRVVKAKFPTGRDGGYENYNGITGNAIVETHIGTVSLAACSGWGPVFILENPARAKHTLVVIDEGVANKQYLEFVEPGSEVFGKVSALDTEVNSSGILYSKLTPTSEPAIERESKQGVYNKKLLVLSATKDGATDSVVIELPIVVRAVNSTRKLDGTCEAFPDAENIGQLDQNYLGYFNYPSLGIAPEDALVLARNNKSFVDGYVPETTSAYGMDITAGRKHRKYSSQ